MTEEELNLLIGDLLDFLNAIEQACATLREQIGKLKGVDVWSWNPDKIKWEKAQGPSGGFEKSEDFSNPEFKKMLKDLAEHDGKLTRDGVFYWVFKNGSTVGRKKRGSQP